jgi:hypothetical protein
MERKESGGPALQPASTEEDIYLLVNNFNHFAYTNRATWHFEHLHDVVTEDRLKVYPLPPPSSSTLTLPLHSNDHTANQSLRSAVSGLLSAVSGLLSAICCLLSAVCSLLSVLLSAICFLCALYFGTGH